MLEKEFEPIHINAAAEDFNGNGPWGRYVFIPGSDSRAANMASKWKNVKEKRHHRSHNLYLGTMETEMGDIEVASISTGMGCASADIIINELNKLGARNLIRIGTCGSLQYNTIRCGALVVATGAVRDETTSSRYLPPEVPAVASLDFLIAAKLAKQSLSKEHPVHFGLVQSKDSFYAREFLVGPQGEENKRYVDTLKEAGVLATEMEASLLFILGQIFGARAKRNNEIEHMMGAILAVVGDDIPKNERALIDKTVEEAIQYGFKTIETLHGMRTDKIKF